MRRALCCLLLVACGEAPVDFTDVAAPTVIEIPSDGGAAAGGASSIPETGGAGPGSGGTQVDAGAGGLPPVATSSPTGTGGKAGCQIDARMCNGACLSWSYICTTGSGGADGTGGTFASDGAVPPSDATAPAGCASGVSRPCGVPQRCPLGRQSCVDGAWGPCVDAQSGQLCL